MKTYKEYTKAIVDLEAYLDKVIADRKKSIDEGNQIEVERLNASYDDTVSRIGFLYCKRRKVEQEDGTTHHPPAEEHLDNAGEEYRNHQTTHECQKEQLRRMQEYLWKKNAPFREWEKRKERSCKIHRVTIFGGWGIIMAIILTVIFTVGWNSFFEYLFLAIGDWQTAISTLVVAFFPCVGFALVGLLDVIYDTRHPYPKMKASG